MEAQCAKPINGCSKSINGCSKPIKAPNNLQDLFDKILSALPRQEQLKGFAQPHRQHQHTPRPLHAPLSTSLSPKQPPYVHSTAAQPSHEHNLIVSPLTKTSQPHNVTNHDCPPHPPAPLRPPTRSSPPFPGAGVEPASGGSAHGPRSPFSEPGSVCVRCGGA